MKTVHAIALSALISTSVNAATTIDFETLPDGSPISAPLTFVDTSPLADEFAAYGIHFNGTLTKVVDGIESTVIGGSVLNADSFSSNARSGSNVLAFNTAVTDATETITFDNGIGFFEIYGSASRNNPSHSHFSIQAFNASGARITSRDIHNGSPNQLIGLQSANDDIYKIVLTSYLYSNPTPDHAFFYDDLTFGAYSEYTGPAPSPVPAPGSFILFGSALAGLIASRKCK